MPAVTDFISIDQSKSEYKNFTHNGPSNAKATSEQISVPGNTPQHSTGTISFRERLSDIRDNTGNGPNTTEQHNYSVPNRHRNVPLYSRLYGEPASFKGTRTHTQSSVEIQTTKQADSTNNSSHLKVTKFANSIRKHAAVAARELGTTTNTVIAFAGLETGWGKHIPSSDRLSSNNLFGIKAQHNSQPYVTSSTVEYIRNEAQRVDQQFRSYQSISESILDFSNFLRNNKRYEEALRYAKSPKMFIRKVHEAGYATDPNYANKVIAALNKLDNIAPQSGAIGIGW